MFRIIAIALAIYCLLITLAVMAGAHEAPLGWEYDYKCCSGVDCRQIPNPKETSEGFVMPSGEVVPYGDHRVNESKDEFFHWCTVRGLDTSRTLCIYVPNRGF